MDEQPTVIEVDEEVPTNNAPVFTDGSSTTRSVSEDAETGVDIGTPITATDADNDTLTYRLSGQDASTFGIDTGTGQLKTSAALDYETKAIYSVSVSVSDGKITDLIAVTINVTDVEEVTTRQQQVIEGPSNNAPVFTDGSSTTRSVSEDAEIGVDIGSPITATDADGETITYTLGGTDASVFSIDSTTGQLHTNTALDYETKSSYTVTITASDGTAETTITVAINVVEVTESVVEATENRAPVFTAGSSTTRSVLEGTGSGIAIGSAISATDADGDTLTYTLGGTDASSFSIVSTSGQLQTNAALHYETKPSYSVTITVSDGSLTDSITVTINVTDVSDTNNAPVFSDGSSTTRFVAENTVSSTNIGAAVAATDADNHTLTYTLAGIDAASFSIVSTSGQLQTSTALVYATQATYTVTVSVSDNNGGSDSITVTINVTKTITPVNQRTQEVQTAIVAAIAGVNSADDVTTAHLAALTSLDFGPITLGVNKITTLKDGDFSGMTALTELSMVEHSISDISPLADLTALTNLYLWDNSITDISALSSLTNLTKLSLYDNSISNISALGSLTALTNLNLSSNSITDISALASLTKLTDLNLSSNSISDISALDDLTKLTALQLGGNPISDISALDDLTKLTTLYLHDNSISDITALDDLTKLTTLRLNGNSISDISALANLTSLKFLWLDNNSISDISALDDLTKLQWFHLTNNSISDVSALEELTSLTTLYLSGNPISDYGPLRTLKTTIEAASKSISIDIDINNNPPVFTDGSSTSRSVAENTAAGQNIGDAIAATDTDTGTTLKYSLGGTDADSFSIVSTSGQLQTKAALDYETKTSYTVTVDVSDGNDGLDRITVTINVTDVAGAAPPVETPPIIPDNTSLFSNFPNPFNPETWIPYQLAKSAEVTLTIYNMRVLLSGRLRWDNKQWVCIPVVLVLFIGMAETVSVRRLRQVYISIRLRQAISLQRVGC